MGAHAPEVDDYTARINPASDTGDRIVHCWPPIDVARESMASGLVRRVRRWR